MKKALFLSVLVLGLVFAANLAVAQTSNLTAVIVSPASGSSHMVGQTIAFAGNANGGLAPYNFQWNFGDSTSAAGQSFNKVYSQAGNYTVTLSVTDLNNNHASISQSITVANNTPTNPTVDLRVNNSNGSITVATGTAATLSWTSTNATSCSASGAWSGSRDTSGSESTGVLNTTGSFTYTLTCSNGSNSASDSVIVNVQANTNPGVAPIISNIRVTDITQTTAIVRWDTNIPADSRVIYDTVSHPTIDPSNAPNFGYAFSTGTSNTNPKVTEHAVQLTSLSPNTQYFFRVLSQS